MRKRNSVAQLNRTHSHRKAMMRNMATSLFEHERIVTTRAKAKALRGYSEKLITRAKKNLSDADAHKELHNKREVMRHLRDRDVVKKLFEDIAPRFKDRNGGYTRIIHLPDRQSDSAEMSIIELVDRKEKIRKVPEKKAKAKPKKKKDGTDATDGESKKGDSRGPDRGDDRKGKWYDRFRRKKRDSE